MNRLKFQPNEIARGLAKKRTRTIALIIPDIANPFFPELVVAIEKVAKSKGYTIVLLNTYEDDLKDHYFWSQIQNRYIDGIIVASFNLDIRSLKRIEELGIPFVRIDRAAAYNTENSIGVDNYKGAKIAVEHLFEVGCKKVAHISGPKSLPLSLERKRGYIETVAKMSKDNPPIVYEGDFTLTSGKQLTEKLLQEHPDVDGIFLANDLMAIGSLKALKSLNISTPEDIAIIGFDGIELTEMVEPEISTVEQPIYKIGAVATNRLIYNIEDAKTDFKEVDLEVKLIKRQSTLGYIPK
ncbi:LacI family DNA-binding transcriptional regulator [Tuberibacillus calidus]|uniref:LacI family DNA-binding transcriptional regulator n=1 Tax=Tuberibacillus calidus TaxID=340097 RepID=UPI00040EBFDC|nr:LacI family DNA-binding transcriptional regulator [Tuberibacillus calidus]